MSGATSKGRKGTALGRIRQLMAIARKKALAPCPSTGSVTATTIKSQSSSSLAHRQFMPVCVLPLMGWIKALYRRARRTRHLGRSAQEPEPPARRSPRDLATGIDAGEIDGPVAGRGALFMGAGGRWRG
jgi:hypothetical protein